jgi:nucleoid DNA-binding protein
MSKMNEAGRKEIAAIIERMSGANAGQTVDNFRFMPPAVAELLAAQLKAKQVLAQTDESVELTARVEIHNFGVVNAKILPAETKTVRNPGTGESFEKSYPARVKILFSVSDNLEEITSKALDL